MLGRCFGIALFALGQACWPGGKGAGPGARGMLSYNVPVALCPAYLGGFERMGGWLLWQAAEAETECLS